MPIYHHTGDGSCCCSACDREAVAYCLPPLSGFGLSSINFASNLLIYSFNGRRITLEPRPTAEEYACRNDGYDLVYDVGGNLTFAFSAELHLHSGGTSATLFAGGIYTTDLLDATGGTFTLTYSPPGFVVPPTLTLTAAPGDCPELYCPRETVWCLDLGSGCRTELTAQYEDGSGWLGSFPACARGRTAILTIEADGTAWVVITPIGFSDTQAVYSGAASCSEPTELGLVGSTGPFMNNYPDPPTPWPGSITLMPGECPQGSDSGSEEGSGPPPCPCSGGDEFCADGGTFDETLIFVGDCLWAGGDVVFDPVDGTIRRGTFPSDYADYAGPTGCSGGTYTKTAEVGTHPEAIVLSLGPCPTAPPGCSGGSFTATLPVSGCFPSGGTISLADAGGGTYLGLGPPAGLLDTSASPPTLVVDRDGDSAVVGNYRSVGFTCAGGGTFVFVSGDPDCDWPPTVEVTP